MRIDLVLIMLGATLLVVLSVITVRPWLANVASTVPSEVPEPIAMLIAGTIAFISLAVAFYLALQEWKEVKYRRARANEERRP